MGEIEVEILEVGVERVVRRIFIYRIFWLFILFKDKSFWGFKDEIIFLLLWLMEEDVVYYVSKFEEKGYIGGVNYYCNFDW